MPIVGVYFDQERSFFLSENTRGDLERVLTESVDWPDDFLRKLSALFEERASVYENQLSRQIVDLQISTGETILRIQPLCQVHQ